MKAGWLRNTDCFIDLGDLAAISRANLGYFPHDANKYKILEKHIFGQNIFSLGVYIGKGINSLNFTGLG